MASRSTLDLLDDGDPRRKAPRCRVMLSAKLETAHRTYDVVLRDVSLTGARLTGAELPPLGARGLLRRGSFRVNGAIMWAAGEAGGFQWDFAFHDDDELTDALKGLDAPLAPTAPPYRRPGVASRGGGPRFSDGTGWIDRPRSR